MSAPRIAATAAMACLLVACEPNNQGYAPDQPINYSHAVHAGAMQIPCEYCHYAAEKGVHAGIPPASLCLNCHLQVQKEHPEILKLKSALDKGEPVAWVKVHYLPDHVYFNHSVHVNAKVTCQTCHGPVETMGRMEQWAPLTMGWCVECHRNKSTGPNDKKQVRASPLTDCAVCHH